MKKRGITGTLEQEHFAEKSVPLGVALQITPLKAAHAKENRMLSLKNKVLMALSICLSTSALAQTGDERDATAGPTSLSERGTASEQPTEAASPPLGQGTQAQAEHSAEATAHKSVGDPNNQLGTSLQGRTRPVAGADVGSQNDAASTGTPSQTGAQ